MIRGFIRRGQPLMALVLVLGGWVSARAMMWDAGGMPRVGLVRPPMQAPAAAVRSAGGVSRQAHAPRSAPSPGPFLSVPPLFGPPRQPFDQPVTLAGMTYSSPSPYGTLRPVPQLRASLAPVTPDDRVPAEIASGHRLMWMAALTRPPAAAGYIALPDNAAPFPVAPAPRSAERRWSADAWVLWRRGSGQSLAAGGFAPTYGASQAGGVLRYRLATGSAHRPAAYLRASAALNGSNEREVALGLQARPIGRLPVVLAGEARFTATPGRTDVRPAVFAVTELPPFALPLGLRGEAYAQGGYVGGAFATAFADGQLRVDRRLLGLGQAEMRLGGGVWGGVQKGASRLDAGPSFYVAAPLGGPASMRLGADWRFRVAGTAAPASGPAVTLSAGF